jgi:hypothetical protein
MSTSRAADVWCERCWPVLAGVAAAAGLLDLVQLLGLRAVALLVVGLWSFFAVVLYGAGSEAGLRPRTAVRVGLVATVSILALLGLTELFPAGGWFVALAVGATSPALAHHVGPHVRQGLQVLGRRTSTRSDPDQAAVDRAFDTIIAQLEKDGA